MKFQVEGINFGYRSNKILENVCFEIRKGSLCALLGVNGAGKSTLLKCMNRILHPVAGTVMLGETNILGLKGIDIAKRIGYVPQNGSGDGLSVFDMIMLGRKPYIRWNPSVADIEVVERVVKMLSLENMVSKKLGEISGGELQKIIIARAIVQEPELLLLDEPTSNLDMKNQYEVMSIVRNLADSEKSTVIVSMHDINLALRFADSFVFLANGTITAVSDKKGITAGIIKDVYGMEVEIRYEKDIPVIIPVI